MCKRQPWVALALAAAAPDWRSLDPANTLLIDTTRGRIVIEMRPDIAPLATARVRTLARAHVYDGLLFHRVLDHYVDQTGTPDNRDGGVTGLPDLPPDFRFTLADASVDALATRSPGGITGFIGSIPFAAAANPQNPATHRAWGVYCAGVVGMGRQEAVGSANSEIFIMRDENRSLDHDYTVWGRVVQGLDVARAIAVGEPPAHPDRMLDVQLASDLPAAARPRLQVTDTRGAAFHAEIAALRAREGADFSVCDLAVHTR